MENKIFAEKVSKLDHLFDRTIKSVSKERNYDPNNENIKEIEKNLKEAQRKSKDQTFQIGVLALVKSGKSTFINSLLGAEYLPTSNIPETVRIVKIIHSKEKNVLKDKSIEVTGTKAIFKYLKELNEKMRDEGYSNVSEKELILKVPLECLKEKEFDNVVFEILDTPGPNEAGAEPLRNKVKRLLQDIDVIIYLLDYTKLKTAEEKELVDEIAKRKDLIEKLDRLFFIVNKVDMENRNSLTVEETSDYVCALLKKQIPSISKEKILVVAAEKALVSRLILNKTADQQVISDFAKKAFGEHEHKDKTLDNCMPKAPKSLENSHLLEVEDKVISFLFKNRAPILVDILSKSLEECTNNLYNYFGTARSAKKKDEEELELIIQQLEEDIEKLKINLEEVNRIAKNTERDISHWIDGEFERFRNEVSGIIDMSFQYKKREVQNSGGVIAWLEKKAVIAAKVLSKAPISNPKIALVINGLGEVIGNIFDRKDELSVKNQEEASDIFFKVNKEIERIVKGHFEDFRYELENKTASKQKELYKKFEAVVNDMARKIEQKIGKQFELILKKVEIKFSVDSIDKIHKKLQKGIDNVVKKVEKIEQKKTSERVLIEEENSFGSDKYTYVDRYEDFKGHSYDLSKSKLKALWLKEIDKMNKVSVSTAKYLAKKNITKSIKMAKGKIETYANGYLDTIRRELEEKRKGKEEQKARAEMLSQNIKKIKQVSEELEEMRMQ